MGRPRKALVKREPNGQAVRAGAARAGSERVHPESLAARERALAADGVPAKEALNSLAGFSLGRLFLRGRASHAQGITEEQYNAGESWARIIHRHGMVMGYEVRQVRSAGFIMVGGTSCAPEPDQDEIDRVRAKFAACYDGLMALKFNYGSVCAVRVAKLCYGICIDNWPLERLRPDDFQWLRIGLNALAKVLG